MNDSLFKVINFMDGNKWFVIAQTVYNNEDYKYLIKLTEDEEDFKEEFLLVKYYVKDNGEYVEKVKNPDILEKVMLQIMPEIKPLLQNKNQILEQLKAK